MKRLLPVLLLMLCFPLRCLADDLRLQAPGPVRSFEENEIIAVTQAAGVLDLSLADEHGPFITWTEWVDAGENPIVWDGLGDFREPIPAGTYTLRGTLNTYDGQTHTGETSVTIQQGRNTLLYALPSSDTLYQQDQDKWFFETELLKAGATVVMDVHREGWGGSPMTTKTWRLQSDHPAQLTWDGKADGHPLAAGEYLLRCYTKENPDQVHEMTLTIREGKRPELPVEVTGAIMPTRNMTDAEIWAIMQKPSVVANLNRQTDHLKIRSGKGKGDVLGTVHGQSQAMEVLEIDGRYARIGAWNHETGDYVEGWVTLKDLTVVTPSTEYGLLVDKQRQTCTLYFQGKAIDTFAISTGLPAKNHLTRETPAGSFLTVDRVRSFEASGYQYDYAIRYDGDNLLRQLGYAKGRDFAAQSALLGMKSGDGGVSLPRIPQKGGVNAYWLYTHLPYHTRVILLDDPEERRLHAAAAGAKVELGHTLPTAPEPLKNGEYEVLLTVGGDAVIGTRESWWDRADALPAYLEAHGMSYPFSGLRDIFAADDMTLVNLECVLKADASGEDKGKLYRFRGLPDWTQVLTVASVEQVSIANNHYIDYGEKGRSATRQALEDAGVPYSGFGCNHIWDVQGVRIGFGGCRETVYLKDPAVIQRDVAAMKQAGCDLILYTCHWGKEYSPTHNETQEGMAIAAAAAGADIVLGGHPHVVQGVDCVEDTLILYSLGNLMFGGTIEMTTFDGMLAQLRLRFDAEGYVGCTLSLIPVLTSGRAAEGINDFRPVVAEGEDKARILQKVQDDTAFPLMEAMWFPANRPSCPVEEGTAPFTWAEVQAMYPADAPGVITEGFVSTVPAAIGDASQAIEVAQKERTVAYDAIAVDYDEQADVWCVCFFKKEQLGGNQRVYLDGQGLTRLIVYGE